MTSACSSADRPGHALTMRRASVAGELATATAARAEELRASALIAAARACPPARATRSLVAASADCIPFGMLEG